MAEFLDTTAISYHLEKLLKSARHRILLISPYLKLRPRIRELIHDATCTKVNVQVVYGKKEKSEGSKELRDLSGVQVTFCENLHAKCYLNEEFGIVTSLNLYDFSEANNQEMGILFHRSSDATLYQQVLEEAERIIRISGGVNTLAATLPISKPFEQHEKLTTSKLADRLGILATALYDRLIGRGYLELKHGKRYLTEKGKNVGGESGMGNGASFLWPPDLEV